MYYKNIQINKLIFMSILFYILDIIQIDVKTYQIFIIRFVSLDWLLK